MSKFSHHSYTFFLKDRKLVNCLGAFCRAFDELEWVLTCVRAGKPVTGYIPLYEEERIADITITPQENNALYVHLQAADEVVTPQQLKDMAISLDSMVEVNLLKMMDIELQADYRRKLQQTDMNALKNKKGNVFVFLRDVFLTKHPAQMVAILIALNVAVFIAMAIAGAGVFDTNAVEAVEWGAASKYKVLSGEYWRLLTACFIHFGIGHLAANIIGLIYASIFLMLVLNRWQFLFGYLASGLISMSVSMWWHDETITAGASGAIFGCYGMLLGLTLTRLFSRSDRVAIFVYLAIYLGINLLYGFKDGIDGAAHLGGLFSGIIIGWLYYFPLQKPSGFLAPAVNIVVIVLGLFCSCLILSKATYYGFTYEQLRNRYSAYESDALEFYRVQDTTMEVKMALLDKGILQLEKALQVADSMVQIEKQPAHMQLYALRLGQYTRYRLVNLQVTKRAYGNYSHELADSITLLNGQIDSILKVFKEE